MIFGQTILITTCYLFTFQVEEATKDKPQEIKEESLKQLFKSPVLRRNMICLILNLYVFISSYGKLSFEFCAYLFVFIVYMLQWYFSSLSRLVSTSTVFGLSLLPGSVLVNITLMAVFDMPGRFLIGKHTSNLSK